MLKIMTSIISIFRKEYFLYEYKGEGNKSTHIQTYKARNMRIAIVKHLNSFHPVIINMEKFKFEESHSEFVAFYSFEVEGESQRYMLIRDKVFDMYYKSKETSSI